MAKLDSIFKDAGTLEGNVQVDISYDIIKHVSAQLYTNPRKAIEELVCNAYDAGATECHVQLPKDASEALIVLDNGKSMDLEGLRNLWMVAKSPKTEDKEGRRIANNRLQIGKFGVGKLAAYALGRQLTHVATTRGETRIVSVSVSEIKERGDGGAPRFQVYKLKEPEARAYLEPFLGRLPRPWKKSWHSWTLAMVEDVEEENFLRSLKVGILRRMITTALPISKDFKVYLDAEVIPERQIAPEDIELEIDVMNSEFRAKLETVLREFWQNELHMEKIEDVTRGYFQVNAVKIPSPTNASKEISAIEVPQLGPVAGKATLAWTTLTTEKLSERGYVNNGFSISVNGKVVNSEDELFGVSPRSHAFWRRFLARVEMPGLDDVLLVQRNAVSENKPKARIARELMRTLFEFTRSLAEKREEEAGAEPEAFGSKIGKISPFLAPLAIEGLGGGKTPDGGVSGLKIEFVSLAETNDVARYDATEHTIQVNVEHPIIAALNDLSPPLQKQWRKVMGEIVAGGKLAEGFLIAKGVGEGIVLDAAELLDAALRSAASYIRDPVEEHIKEIEEASYPGGTRFENAVVNALKAMRLVAYRVGGPGNPDGIIEIPRTGEENLRISVEAKGTGGVITHKQLSEATVTRHEEKYGCSQAIAIAREYQTEGKSGEDSGLVQETRGIVPLLTVQAIAKMLRLQQQRPFTYDKVATILTTWTHPEELEDFVEKTWRELPEMGLMRLILEVAHEKMDRHVNNFPDPGMLVDDSRLIARKITKQQIKSVLEALAVTTRMIVIQDHNSYEFKVIAPVETILEAMTRASQERVSTDSEVPTNKKR